MFQGLGCPLGYPLLRASCAQGARLEVSGGRRCGYLCALSGRCALVSGQMGSGIPGRSAESSPAWIMSLCSEGLCGVARSLIPGWRMRCTPGYVAGVSSLAGWGHDYLDGEGAVGTDYTGCRQRVRRLSEAFGGCVESSGFCTTVGPRWNAAPKNRPGVVQG